MKIDLLNINKDKCRELVRKVIWRIAQDEGGHILHYNDWVDDNWNILTQNPHKVKKE